MYLKKTTGMELDQKSARRSKAQKMILKVRDSIQTVFSKKKTFLWKETAEKAVTVEIERNHSHSGSGPGPGPSTWKRNAHSHIEAYIILLFKKKRRAEQSTEEKTIKHRWYCVGTEKPQQNTFHRGIRCITIYANACFLLFTLFISLP